VGSHGSGPVKVIPTVFPFHPASFARLEPVLVYFWQSLYAMATFPLLIEKEADDQALSIKSNSEKA